MKQNKAFADYFVALTDILEYLSKSNVPVYPRMDLKTYLREFRTISVGVQRQAGKTSWVLSKLGTDCVYVTYNGSAVTALAQNYTWLKTAGVIDVAGLPVTLAASHIKDVSGLLGAHFGDKKIRILAIDEASLIAANGRPIDALIEMFVPFMDENSIVILIQ